MNNTLPKIDFKKKTITCSVCGDTDSFQEFVFSECPFCKGFHYFCCICQSTYKVVLPGSKLYSKIEQDDDTNIIDAYIPITSKKDKKQYV